MFVQSGMCERERWHLTIHVNTGLITRDLTVYFIPVVPGEKVPTVLPPLLPCSIQVGGWTGPVDRNKLRPQSSPVQSAEIFLLNKGRNYTWEQEEEEETPARTERENPLC